MKKFTTVASKPVISLIFSLLLSISGNLQAEDYVAVDALYMDTRIAFGNGTLEVDLTPIRLKYGRRYKEFGWEVHVLTPADDSGISTTTSLRYDYEINHGIGLLMTVSTPNRHWYGGLGFTFIDSTITRPSDESRNNNFFSTINIGGQFNLTEQARITLDYTHYLGQIDCNFCISTGPNPSEPDVQISSIAAGFSYTFD